MINTVYTTDQGYIKYLNCDQGVNRRIIFQTCNLSVIEGANTLQSLSLCDFSLPSLSGGENGGCGGSATRKVTIQKSGAYTLTAPEVGQEQGEVQLIAVKVKYDKDHPLDDQFLFWEYKGSVYPLGKLMVLTGVTKSSEPWYGWDLSYYSNNPPNPDFSPQPFPPIASPDLNFGGILFSNPSTTYDVDLEIMIFN